MQISRMHEVVEITGLDGRVLELSEWPLWRILRGERVRSKELRVPSKESDAEGIYSYTGDPIYDQKSEIVMGIMTAEDIAGCKRAEQALSESEERLRRVIDSAPVGIFVKAHKKCSRIRESIFTSTCTRVTAFHNSLAGAPIAVISAILSTCSSGNAGDHLSFRAGRADDCLAALFGAKPSGGSVGLLGDSGSHICLAEL